MGKTKGKQIVVDGLILGEGDNTDATSGQLSWVTGLGALTHIEGPSDQFLTLNGGNGASAIALNETGPVGSALDMRMSHASAGITRLPLASAGKFSSVG